MVEQSPGHSAKFASYTLMELKKRVVIDVQLVQVSGSINNVDRTLLLGLPQKQNGHPIG